MSETASRSETSRAGRGKLRIVLPFAVFALLVAALGVSVRLSGRVPSIDSVSPHVATPGEIMTIRGRAFGDRKDGNVIIAGVIPTSSAYLEWSDTKISVRVPEDTGSGLVYVETAHGRSNGVLFSNRGMIPQIVSGPVRAGHPYIEAVDPALGSPGTLVSIRGMNFGTNRNESLVSFAWISSENDELAIQADVLQTIPCSTEDFDYEYWSDGEIRVRVPSGSVSGNIFVKTDRGTSNGAFFEVSDEVGTRVFHEKLTYSVQNSVDILDVVSEPGNDLYLWVPRVQESVAQRAAQVVERSPKPMLENFQGSTLYRIPELATGLEYRIVQSFMFDRYTEENRIKTSKVVPYDTKKTLYRVFTAPDQLVVSDNPEIVSRAKTLVGREKNPYLIAKAIYDWVRRTLEYDPAATGRDPAAAMTTKRGSDYDYAMLYCALLRAAGIPSRPISGYLVKETMEAVHHYWTELYLENYGWIPVDPLLGDEPPMMGVLLRTDAAAFYFGGVDNRHIELIRGVRDVTPIDPRAARVRKEQPFSFQTFHEEAAGRLTAYRSVWSDLSIIGVY